MQFSFLVLPFVMTSDKIAIIKTDNPFEYRDQIVRLWDECLPNTPAARLDWMAEGNPAGPTQWHIALNKKDDTVVATSSLMPKDFFLNGKKIKGGIVGDIMTAPMFRIRGVAQTLLQTIRDDAGKSGIEFLYSVPNDHSRKLLMRAGLSHRRTLSNYLIPVDIEFYLKKIAKSLSFSLNCKGHFFSTVVDRLFNGSEYDNSRMSIQDAAQEVGPEFDDFWSKLKAVPDLLISSKSSAYLNWRYGKHPDSNFRILKYKDSSGRVAGYCVFNVENGRLYLWEMLSLEKKDYACLIAFLRSFARQQGCYGIYLYSESSNPVLKILRLKGLFRIGGDMSLLYAGLVEEKTIPWMFFPGERNI